MFQKKLFIVCVLALFFFQHSNALASSSDVSSNKFYGIVNLNTNPSFLLSNDDKTTGAENIFSNGSLGVDLLGGIIFDLFILELGFAFTDYFDIDNEVFKDPSTYIKTFSTTSFDSKLAVLYKLNFNSTKNLVYSYIGPQLGISHTTTEGSYAKYSIGYEGIRESDTDSFSSTSLMYGLKAGLRISFLDKYLADIGLSYLRKNAGEFTLLEDSFSGNSNNISLNIGLGFTF